MHKKLMPADKEYKNGYLDVVFDDVHMKVPREYVAQNTTEDSFFDLIVMYPSMLSSREYEGNTDKKYDAFIRILFEYKSNSFSDHNRVLQRFYDRGWIKESVKSEHYPGLVKHVQSSGAWFYSVSDRGYLSNNDDPIIFYCHAFGGRIDAPGNLNDCDWHIDIGDASIRVDLKQSHLRDWPAFISKVSAFIEGLVVSGQSAAKISP